MKKGEGFGYTGIWHMISKLIGLCLFFIFQMAKNLSAMSETWVRSLGQEESLEKEMATHCSILAWRIPWTEEPGRLQFLGSLRVAYN